MSATSRPRTAKQAPRRGSAGGSGGDCRGVDHVPSSWYTKAADSSRGMAELAPGGKNIVSDPNMGSLGRISGEREKLTGTRWRGLLLPTGLSTAGGPL